MYQKHGWYFPDQDQHFVEMLDKNITKGRQPVYQEPIRQASIRLTDQRRVALDIGANIGLWSRDLTQSFEHVIAFEPVAAFVECLRLNAPAENLEIKTCALGAENNNIDMIITEYNTGHSHVNVDTIGQGSIPMITLDSLELEIVDYVKIDCEGYENQILLGAQQTLQRCRPRIVIEDKKHADVGHTDTMSAFDTLQSWGARVLHTVRNDHVMGW